MSDKYHHGDLRNALLEAVGEIIQERGIGAVSLREAARRAGVSHSAPAHHFGDKRGMLTAFAGRGFEEFGQRMQVAADEVAEEGFQAQLGAIGIEYLRFAVERRPYFEVMFRSEMHDNTDPDLKTISHDSFGVLMSVVEAMGPEELGGAEPMHVAMGAWSTVHGLATLWLDGALSQFTDEDLFTLVQGVFDARNAS
ncbi:MAG: TetR/AcrR family transcriptional regulator [Acidimicrobiia bacterium]|nr:TetR/AcrR family transcriptional regulator [Acidimicrobiia bacterium]